MERKLSIGLDNPVFSGRVRGQPATSIQSAYKTNMVSGQKVAFNIDQEAVEVAKRTFEGKFKKPRRLSNRLLYLLAFLLFAAGAIISYQAWLINQQFDDTYVAAESSEVVIENGEVVKQGEPLWMSYSVAPNMPRLLKIPKFDKIGRVMHLGVNIDNQLIAPTNVHDAGWFNGSARPGKKSRGASLMSGHVAGPSEHGIFYDLTKLTIGDEVQVELGNGKILKYQVIGSETKKVNKVDMAKAMNPQSKKPGLNLITCTGQYNHADGEYDSRHVVYTEQIN